ncbi:MAG: fibronectin type III domain-containing protein, partial [Candidatus Yonathbacteria bacterium]|nr:fibronectin type III domain-containing protein [Candidatus Yonathbacteria bacterium]
TDGTVYCWGYNAYGQLGDNTTTKRYTPVKVLGVGGSGYLNLSHYYSSGTFTSAAINLGAPSSGFSTLAFNLNQPTNTDLDVQVVVSSDGTTWSSYYNYDGSTTAIGSTANTARFSKDNTNCTVTGTNPYAVSCSIPSALATLINGKQYIKYKAYLSTTDTSATATLNDITVSYTQYSTSGTLTSSKYDSGSTGNTISGIKWTGSATSSTAIIKFQMRVASTASGLDTAVWQGPTSSSDYFTAGYQTITNSNLTGTTGRQFFQYQASLTSTSDTTPILTGVTIQYVVNAPPTVSNVSASQGSDGTVTVGYDVADTDSSSETITLQYCPTGSTCAVDSDTNWVSATTVTGNVGAGIILGTGKSLVWTPTTDYASQYNGVEKIRVKANDGDAANNLGYGISSSFILDTTAPVISVATIDSSGTQDIVNLTTTDNSSLTYRLCNTADFALCATWTTITSGVATPVNWTAVGAPNAETVYLQVRDAYGNTTSRTITAPAMPTNLLAADVSNPNAQSFGETLSWLSVSNATSYKVYSAYTGSASTAPSSYSLLSNPTTNVYQHTITTATTSAYWYRVAAVNANGDISNFTTLQTLGDVPDSFGTTLPDTTAPTIDSATVAVPTATLKNTSAVITFTTNELAIAKVYYGTTNYGTACNSYGTHITTTSYVTAQSVSLTGLTASTPYYYCLKAVDTLGNPLVDPNTGIDGSAIAPLTTAGGPTITGLQPTAVADTAATVTWNTSTSSDSYIYYGTSASVTNPKTAGSAAFVSCVASVCQHSVGISGLTAGTKYYYYVTSTDSLGNTTPSAIDNFTTTIDITPPVITGITTPVTSSNAVIIVWQTDEPATSQVYYGGTAGSRPNFTTLDTTKSIYHVVTLSSATLNAKGGATDVLLSNNTLTPSTTYYYVVLSSDVAGNLATSPEQTVTTPSTGNVTVVAVSVTAAPTTSGTTPDTTPPVISNVKVSNITPFTATITFDTDEVAVGKSSYGKDTSYGDNASDDFSWGTTHTIKLRGLTLGAEYHIKVFAVDKAGNIGLSDDSSFKTSFLSENISDLTKVENIEQFQKEIEDTIASILPSLIPPFVGRPQITDITEDGATVSFTTNIKSFPVVGFVEENLFDAGKENPYTGETSDTTEKRLNHTLALIGLKPNTTYHIQARAFSLPQVIGKSKDYSFTTKASKIVASIIERKKDSFTVVWTTLEPTSSIVEYKNLSSGRTARVTDDVKKTSHAMKIENLPSATSFSVNVSGINEKGNIIEAGTPLSVMTSKDVTAPALSGFKVANALVPGRTDRIQTIISWTTDELSDSVVYYEEGVGTTGDTKELANKVEVPDLSANHNVILSSLKPGAIYRIKITSTDDSGNTGVFGPRTVITPRQTESITDIIFKNFEDSFKFLRNI